MNHFKYNILYVQYNTNSIELYDSAFGLSRKFIPPENDCIKLTSSQTTLSFASYDLAKNNFNLHYQESLLKINPFGFEIGFASDDVESVFNNAILMGPIEMKKPKINLLGKKDIYIRDLDGFIVEICSPM